MSSFPTEFVEPRPVMPNLLNHNDKELLEALHEKGYQLYYGLSERFAGQIVHMAREPGIKEYCPNDSGSRFIDLAATRQWLQKGRATFLLVKETELVGYGWTGSAGSDIVKKGSCTFAIRIGQAGQGQGLATPFARLIIAVSAKLYEAKDFWLETWASNAAAVHVYHKIGFVDVAQQPSERPTNAAGTAADARVYMQLSNDFLK